MCNRKKNVIWLCIFIAAVFVFMLFADGIQRAHGKITIQEGYIDATVNGESGLLYYKLYIPEMLPQRHRRPASFCCTAIRTIMRPARHTPLSWPSAVLLSCASMNTVTAPLLWALSTAVMSTTKSLSTMGKTAKQTVPSSPSAVRSVTAL